MGVRGGRLVGVRRRRRGISFLVLRTSARADSESRRGCRYWNMDYLTFGDSDGGKEPHDSPELGPVRYVDTINAVARVRFHVSLPLRVLTCLFIGQVLFLVVTWLN